MHAPVRVHVCTTHAPFQVVFWSKTPFFGLLLIVLGFWPVFTTDIPYQHPFSAGVLQSKYLVLAAFLQSSMYLVRLIPNQKQCPKHHISRESPIKTPAGTANHKASGTRLDWRFPANLNFDWKFSRKPKPFIGILGVKLRGCFRPPKTT